MTRRMTAGLTAVLVGLLAAAPAVAREQDPAAVIAPGNVPVAVIRSTTTGHWVVTPCGSSMHVGHGVPIERSTVVIDPGHGGQKDTGAVAPTGIPEKQLNLDVAQEVVGLLAQRGIDAVLTRTADYASLLRVRANLADRLGARMMVSIHHNSPTPGPSPDPGVEVYIQKESTESRRLGGLLWLQTSERLGEFDVAWAGAPDAGVMTVLNSRGDDAYGIIRHPETPTALIELGYLSNRAEAELHLTPEYVPAAAEALATAIERFLTTEDAGAGYVTGRTFNPQPGIGGTACVDPEALQPVSPGAWKPHPTLPSPE